MASNKFPDIETERLVLRKFKESDADAFFKYRPDPRVALYQSESWDNYTYQQAVDFVDKQARSEPGEPDTWFQAAIELKATGCLIGDCAIHTLEDVKQAEIGFTLNPDYQGKGYAAEAVACLVDYLFDRLNIHRIIAVADSRNIGSIKLLEKIGMRKEGHFIKNTWFRGEYADECLYAILKEEWRTNC